MKTELNILKVRTETRTLIVCICQEGRGEGGSGEENEILKLRAETHATSDENIVTRFLSHFSVPGFPPFNS